MADGSGQPGPWAQLKNQIYLGSEEFVEEMQDRIDAQQPLDEIPAKQKRPVARELAYYADRFAPRDLAIAEAYRSGAYSMGEIAAHFGVSRMTVSRAVERFEMALKQEQRNGQWETPGGNANQATHLRAMSVQVHCAGVPGGVVVLVAADAGGGAVLKERTDGEGAAVTGEGD